ncbi:hypothetical protein V2J09_005979 [Rumex salicifolius]
MDVDESQSYYDIHLPIQQSSSIAGECGSFSLEKAVCSHGLFMMAPNYWDPLSSSLLRPLRLSSDAEGQSFLVRISQSSDYPLSLLIRVIGVTALSGPQRTAVTAQVKRMLRLSESEERKVREFQSLHAGAKSGGFGRVFRSPTLFEDMVKCILLCNCQWPRTLTMAKALCQLQLELLHKYPTVPLNAEIDADTKITSPCTEHFCPETPAGMESTKLRKPTKIRKLLFQEETNAVDKLESDISARNQLTYSIQMPEKSTSGSISSDRENNLCEQSNFYNPRLKEQYTQSVGNFPSPTEIASLDEKYLAKSCNLGYRAGRILKLAQSIVEGKIQLKELEDMCNEANSSSYYELDQRMKEINGFGPFTRGNVLMCMGFYNVIPTDSETIRHLKQVHGITATPQTVQKMVEKIYGSYEPFQFLAYWLEVWNFYEQWFGKPSIMPSSEYGLITASKMRAKRNTHPKRSERSRFRNNRQAPAVPAAAESSFSPSPEPPAPLSPFLPSFGTSSQIQTLNSEYELRSDAGPDGSRGWRLSAGNWMIGDAGPELSPAG